MIPDRYADFAERYDLAVAHWDEFEPEVTGFFRRLFGENEIRTVLDCACGTGRHLLLFHSLGCKVWGSDVSESMLARARKNLATRGLEIPLRQADYRDLPNHFSRPFDAVVCLGAIGYMPDEEQMLRALGSMGAILRRRGTLVLKTTLTDRQWREKPRFALAANTEHMSRLFVMDYLERTVHYDILDISHSPGFNGMKQWSAELTVLLRDDQERLLSAAGFRNTEFYGSFDLDPYNRETSSKLIAVAQKE